MQQSVVVINQLRDEFIAFAKTQPAVQQVYASNANYVLLQVADAADCVAKIAAQGILIRNQSSQMGLSQVVRVSIGNPQEMAQVTAAFTEYFANSSLINPTQTTGAN
jgi:histidinol-phosphate aminotransferase